MGQISIVIPLYNKALYIKRAIDSILHQTNQDFEIIVIDDGSTDEGDKVVRAISDSRIRLVQQINQGECAARNKGIEEAKNNLIAFLDADDEWKPLFLETISRLSSSYPDAGAYATAYEMREPNSKIVKPRLKSIPSFPWEGIIPNYFEAALTSFPVWSSAVAIPKNVFNVVGGFPHGEKLGGDIDMWLRIALKYKIAYSTYPMAIYYKDALNRACNQHLNLNGYRIVRTIDEVLSTAGLDKSTQDILLEMQAVRIIQSAKQCVTAFRPDLAREHLKKCKTRRFILRKLFWQSISYLPESLIRVLIYLKHLVNKCFGL
ncbi:MAG: glycosyltransferase family A protein [Candidatus Omnitrophica bacterium]|nr:glycosyltransferase family A protein [Candidatus Omnitrophota bacterium]